MGSLTRVLESRQVNRGRPIPDAKRGHDPDAGLAGGASVDPTRRVDRLLRLMAHPAWLEETARIRGRLTKRKK